MVFIQDTAIVLYNGKFLSDETVVNYVYAL